MAIFQFRCPKMNVWTSFKGCLDHQQSYFVANEKENPCHACKLAQAIEAFEDVEMSVLYY